MTFTVHVHPKTIAKLSGLSEKSKRIIHDTLADLAEDPYPGQHGDKELIAVRKGVKVYRIHIARTWTAFYIIDNAGKRVLVEEVLTIEQAHKKYDRI